MRAAPQAELVKRHAAANQARFYRLAVWPDLFGGYSLAREYGRIGQPRRLRLDPYAEETQALSAMMKLMKLKESTPRGGGLGITPKGLIYHRFLSPYQACFSL